MDHTFLADDHLALNETTFTWPERVIPIINMRYVIVFTSFRWSDFELSVELSENRDMWRSMISDKKKPVDHTGNVG